MKSKSFISCERRSSLISAFSSSGNFESGCTIGGEGSIADSTLRASMSSVLESTGESLLESWTGKFFSRRCSSELSFVENRVICILATWEPRNEEINREILLPGSCGVREEPVSVQRIIEIS